MIREVDLVSYLPPFMAEYKEVNMALTAQNPEFVLVWKEADRTLCNEFITTADEYGISRFEKILGILPSRGDGLEVRRARVLSRWFVELPYTWRMLMKKLTMLCGDGNFAVHIPRLGEYGFSLHVQIGRNEDLLLHEAWGMLEQYLPTNLWYEVIGRVSFAREDRVFIGSGRAGRIRVKAEAKPKWPYRVKAKPVKICIGTGTSARVRIGAGKELQGAYVVKAVSAGAGIGTVARIRLSCQTERG